MVKISLTKLSSKGQIVVPKALREMLGLKTGEIFAVYGKGDVIILKRIKLPTEKEFDKLLRWGEEFAKKRGIKREDIMKAIQDMRKTG